MGRTCYLCNRTASKTKSISLHSFPKNLTIRQKWLHVCNLSSNDDVSRLYVCSIHFAKQDIITYNTVGKSTIKSKAIPSKFKKNPPVRKEKIDMSKIEVTDKICNPVERTLLTSNDDKNDDVNNAVADKICNPVKCKLLTFDDDVNNTGANNIYNTPKKQRKFFEPRYISEITTADFGTPGRASRVIKLMKATDKKKSRQIKNLQVKARRFKKRIKSLQDLVSHLKDKKISEESGDFMTLDDSSQAELGEDNEDDIEYVVERLETDEDEPMEFEEVKEKVQAGMEQEEEKEFDNNQSNEDSTSVIKKIKLPPEQKCRDPLAEAMAHVHSEYLEEEIEDQENVQMEMVVESTNDDMSVLSEVDDAEKTSKSFENEKTIIKATKNGKVLQEESKENLVVTSSLPILNTAYQTNISTSKAPVQNSINFIPIAPNTKTPKTITLMCGNKSFTLTGGTFHPGTQYVLTKLKGKPTALMLTDQKKVIATNEPEKVEIEQSGVKSPTVPSTSQQSLVVNQQLTSSKLPSKKSIVLGKQPPVKQTALKKLRISTYVVDTIKGLPIGGLQVSLYKLMDGKWTFLNENITNVEGHCNDLVEKVNGTIGRYKIHFDVDKYFTLKRIDTMFPFIEIVFDVKNPNTHYHIPLLLSPFGYTTYRGT